jgi:O-antigen/teichoic acid export membrane protein
VTEPPNTDHSVAESPLLKRVLKAGYWMFGLRALDKFVRIVRITVLARLLSPDDFGLFGIALLALSLVESLSQTGFDDALVQREGDVRPYLSTAWSLQVIRGLLLAVVLYVVAPWVAAFFEEPAATPLLRVLGLNAVLLGLTNSGVACFRKELQFHKQFAYISSGTFVDLGISIWAAFALRNAWALVIGMMAGNAVRTMVSHLLASPVRFRIERDKAAPLIRFGRWIWGARIAHYALNEGDDIFVGKLLGTDTLGIYRMAYLYGNLPATEITHVISAITFPAYSRLQHNAAKLREAFLRTLRVTLFISTPFAVGIILVTPAFVRLVLGTGPENPWLPMVVPMQILAAWGFIRSIGATTGPVFQGVGRPDIITKLGFLKLAVLAALIYPLTVRWGLEGTSLAVVGAALVSNPIADYQVIRITGCRVGEFLGALLYPLAASAVMAAAIVFIQALAGPGYGVAVLIVIVVVGMGIYGAAAWALGALFRIDITEAFRAYRNE